MLDRERFCRLRPRLYHFSAAGAWPSIERFGLLCTQDLLERAKRDSPDERITIRELRQRASYRLDIPNMGLVELLDQRPLREEGLTEALGGCMTSQAWVDLLNARVFFWTHPSHAARLTNAISYRAAPGALLELNTKTLLDSYADRVRLCNFNSGYALRRPVSRSEKSYQAIDDYPSGSVGKIREFTILGSVGDVRRHTLSVTTWDAGGTNRKRTQIQEVDPA